MENKIKNYLYNAFSRAADGDAKEEILTELHSNLCEKYNDLIAHGTDPEAAYKQTIDGIGDVEEIISFINSNADTGTRTTIDFTASFEGFEQRMRDLAKDLEGPLREVANDIKNAAKGARDVAKSAKEPIKDIGKQVANDIKEAVAGVEYSQPSRGTYRYDYEVPATDIESIDVNSASGSITVGISSCTGSITFGVSQNDNIYVVELSRQILNDDKRAMINVRNGTLYVSHGKTQVGLFFFGVGIYQSDFEIYLPKKLYNSIRARTSSGDIDLDVGMSCHSLEIRSSSGDIRGKEITCADAKIGSASGDISIQNSTFETAEISSVGGDVKFSGNTNDSKISSTSGDVDVDCDANSITLRSVSGEIVYDGEAESLSAKSTSGDLEMRLSSVPQELTLESVSGDVKAYLPDNDGFTLKYKRISGSIKSDFNLMTSINSKDGSGVYRNGDLRSYTISTVSGDIRLMKK